MNLTKANNSVLRNILLAVLCLAAHFSNAQVLFDNTKAETAGNADWIIDTHQPIPSPSITGVTASTSESYWTGALSSWGIALAKLGNAGQISLPGNGLETLPAGGRITYGDSSNAQDLSHYKVYVVCEPNILFTAAEKTNILNFVKNGGGLFMVADHTGSDRNNDGADSLQVWNDLLNNNAVQNNPFGFTFNADSGTPAATVDTSTSNPMTHGIAGTVTTLKYDVGCTMNVTDTSVCHPSVWQTNPSQVMALYGTYGAGRFCAIGDSSVVEDATSSSGTTYAGWTTPLDNGYCVINGMVWLLNSGVSSNQPPSVSSLAATGLTTNSATLNGSVNPNGQSTTAQFEYGVTTNYGTILPFTGTFSGSSVISVSTNIQGLSSATTYHFRLDATNASGISYGSDQSFTTATNSLPVTNQPPSVTTLAASNVASNSATLNGSLNPNGQSSSAQFEYGLTTSYGTVIPLAGLFTGSNGIAVGTNITGLLAGSTYHFRLDASNLNGLTLGSDQSFTTISTNGGSTSNSVLAGWDVSGLTGYGASPLNPSTNDANVNVTGLTRGAGVGITGTAAAKAWGGNTWNSANSAAAITAGQFATFSLSSKSGYKMSLSSITRFDYRRSSTGPTNGTLQYQVGSGSFVDVTNLSYSSAASSGASLGPIDLTGISALQNVPQGPNVTFRIVNYGATSSGGTWYIYDVAASTAADLSVSGSLVSNSGSAPVITQQPVSITSLSGKTAKFAVVATGSAPIGYQWFFNTNTPLASTASNLSLTTVSNGNSGSYDVVVSNAFGSITSSIVSLVVIPPPSISAGPTNNGIHILASAVAGDAYILQSATNLSNPVGWTTYYSNNVPNGGVIDLVITNTAIMNAQNYFRLVFP